MDNDPRRFTDFSPSLSCYYFSTPEGKKRKWGPNTGSVNIQDDSYLVLGLGKSSSSCVTKSLNKDIEDSSIYHSLNNIYTSKPELDLELSLSTTRTESDISRICQSSVVVDKIQLGDECSTSLHTHTSSRWKSRPPHPLDVNTFSSIEQKNSLPRRGPRAKTCRFNGCKTGARGVSGLCISHGGGNRCQRADCNKGAEGKTMLCKAHGGGRRCQNPECTKSAEGPTNYCIRHGGGKRCKAENCTTASRGKTGFCIRHGGGKRCKIEDCGKSAESAAGVCIGHGGGRRCRRPECTKGAQGSTMLCKAHGGGKRCKYEKCDKSAQSKSDSCKKHRDGVFCDKSARSAHVQDERIHGGGISVHIPLKDDFYIRNGGSCEVSGPEDRVHGGNLMALLRGKNGHENW